ncbi:MAG TPA: serine/threonine-protein kinase [Acidimicrobiales bacterium]|nr:serine/threonine-protein kinase [Acidimicrobiales bacterium]
MSERSYDLIARLGRGGMGVVDLARDADGNKVALKRLTLHGSASEIARSRQRLLREATVLRKLHHPNVVRLLDVVDEGDEIVLVMPYMSGGSLAERVAQHGPAPAAEVERQARRLAGALASAHRAGIVHRDIKPANVLFDDRGEPCLADFGVALSRDQSHGLTVAGMVVGTPAFMAPEQARGDAVSPATDVFSLGATLLFAATGGGPYGQGDPGLLMVRAASGRVERVPKSLPRSLRSLLRAMLEPRPERRPSAAELAGADGGAGAPVPAARPPGGRRAAAALGAVVATAAVAVAGVAVSRGGGSGTAGDAEADGGPATASAGDCVDLPYQPCGEPPAPHTDGASCIDDHDDYDGLAANGCEAAPDDRDGERLDERVEANVVPRDDVDTYVLELDDEIRRRCDGAVEIRLEAPPGMVLELELRDHLGIVDRASGVDGIPAVVRLTEERCGADDRTAYDVVVRATGDARVADDYVLTREGGF